jgi:hypothetical protein
MKERFLQNQEKDNRVHVNSKVLYEYLFLTIILQPKPRERP